MQQYLIMGIAGAAALGLTGYVSYNKGYDNGANAVTVKWQEDVIARDLAMDQAIKALNSKQDIITEKVVTDYVDRVNTIRDVQTVNQEVIKEVFLESPFVPEGWVYAHDQIVDKQPIDPVLAGNLTPSNQTFTDALLVVARNYGVAHEGEERDKAWNDFYNGVRSSYDDYELPEGASSSRTGSETTSSTNGTNNTTTQTGASEG